MNRYKFRMSIVTFIFLILVWYFQNNTYINVYSSNRVLTLNEFKELLYYMNSSATGYSSIQNYSLVYLVPFLLLLQQFIGTDLVFNVVRFSRRSSLYKIELLNIILASIIISIAHTMVNVILSFFYFDSSFVLDSNLIYYSIINVFVLIFFYTAIGLIYSLIKTIFLSNGIGIIGTLLIVGGTFFISKTVLSSFWTPLVDLSVLTKLIEEEFTIYSIGWIYLKQIITVTILYLIGTIVSSRKDFL